MSYPTAVGYIAHLSEEAADALALDTAVGLCFCIGVLLDV